MEQIDIDVRDITHVLLADGWHAMAWDGLNIDRTVYRNRSSPPEEIDAAQDASGSPYGFAFTEELTRSWISGPLSSILAVRADPD